MPTQHRPITFEEDVSGCFNVTSHKPRPDGYSEIWDKGKRCLMHRYVYQQDNGPIPEGKVVRHSCDNPRCINPKHLLLGTFDDNMKDRAERGLGCRGEAHHWTRLTDDQVDSIRASDLSQPALAKEYGVSQSTISRIRGGRRRNWCAPSI
jgi:hypothetical protein